jgi:hypothetical protein
MNLKMSTSFTPRDCLLVALLDNHALIKNNGIISEPYLIQMCFLLTTFPAKEELWELSLINFLPSLKSIWWPFIVTPILLVIASVCFAIS